MPAYVPPQKRKLDSVDASSATTSSKHLKLSSKPTTSTTSTSLPSTSLSTQEFQPTSPGENLIAFVQQVQPPRSISPGSSCTSKTSSSTATSSTSWRSQSSTTSVSSFASQSSWRSGTSYAAAPATAPARPRTTASQVQIGQICFLPNQASIATGEPIHSHPDFINNSKAFDHPCVVVDGPDNKGYVTCFQLTSFGQYQGLMDKYADRTDQYGWPQSMASQRMRWLLIECGGVIPNHDNLPMLYYESPCSARLPKCTYVNCETWFKVRPSDLVVQGRVKKLSSGSVQAAWVHHGVLENTYGVMKKAVFDYPGLVP
ncbi:hypothetical protein Vi05172_g12769 [Venturia inaequalis]|nr:hypothetical protein Vi05172_g12769 [Venturia inaequalis]